MPDLPTPDAPDDALQARIAEVAALPPKAAKAALIGLFEQALRLEARPSLAQARPLVLISQMKRSGVRLGADRSRRRAQQAIGLGGVAAGQGLLARFGQSGCVLNRLQNRATFPTARFDRRRLPR